MKAEEKRRRFHEALLQMLYPPPHPPPKEDIQESVDTLSEGLNLDQFSDELEGGRRSPSSSGADEGEGEGEGGGEGECDGPKKLTRAQRKRLRKKKLKEAASRRRKITGPTLQGSEDDCLEEAQGVRQNASVVPHTGGNEAEPEEPRSCTKRSKRKHRRMAKKLAVKA